MSNPFFKEFSAPFEAVPFDEIKPEHYMPAVKEAIKRGKAEIDDICVNTAVPTFENTIEALENSGKLLNTVSSVFFNLNSAETNDEIQALARDISPLLTEHSNDVLLNEKLFERVKTVFENSKALDLSVEQQTLLSKTYKGFVRNGANLSEDKKALLRELDKQLSQLSLAFGENVLKATNDFSLIVTDENQLKGLPEGVVEAAAMEAKSRDLEGWVFTLDYPSYIPFMTYAEDRALRKEMYMAFGSRAVEGEVSNQQNVLELATLRDKRAKLLGYDSHAHFVLEERMARSADTVVSFLEDLLVKAKPVAEKEVLELEAYAKKEGGVDKLERWDFNFFSEKIKREKYAIDDEMLKPYFQLEKVVEGVFETATRLFDITFHERKDIPVYHEEVSTYEVKDKDGNHVALFYADFFPRKGKRNGAWMTSYRGQSGATRPLVSIVCNFTKPTNTKPSLLTFNEVTTLFHEFGHALHGMLANTTYESLAGTNVFWDFVELPSQIMENWAFEKECLDLFATHYETGEKIPLELVEKIKESSNYLEGYQTVRQISFGLLDMSWHSAAPEQGKSVAEIEKAAMQSTELFAPVPGTNMSCAFSHIFQGGYSAGYYSYKWAEVLDADAFESFQENGIFDKATAQAFKDNILSKGGTEHPMELYKRFKGKEPQVDALLKRAGLVVPSEG